MEVGTKGYMAPELNDPRSTYSAGSIFFELLSGRRLQKTRNGDLDADFFEVLEKSLSDLPEWLQLALVALCKEMLEHAPDDRILPSDVHTKLTKSPAGLVLPRKYQLTEISIRGISRRRISLRLIFLPIRRPWLYVAKLFYLVLTAFPPSTDCGGPRLQEVLNRFRSK